MVFTQALKALEVLIASQALEQHHLAMEVSSCRALNKRNNLGGG
jgi:hypothetical protein